MSKTPNCKRKLPILAKLLLERSDEDHPITRQDMQDELARWGLSAERKSLYDDMEQLRELGLDVQAKRGRNGGWYIGQRDFELAELKLLVDAVQSSRFLTKRKSDVLIRKLEGLACVHQARQLQRQVYVDRRVKTMNESIFYNVDRLHGAIAANRVITFRYFEYNAARERVFRRAGDKYRATPFGLVWDSENYYLAGWDELHKEVRHYRVDKMADIFITGTGGTGTRRATPGGTSVCTRDGPAPCGCGAKTGWRGWSSTASGWRCPWCPTGRGISPPPWTWWPARPCGGGCSAWGRGWRCCPRTGRWTSSPASSRRCGRRIIRPRMGQTA